MNMNRLLARYGFKISDEPSSHAGKLLDATMRKLGSHTEQLEEMDESLWREALICASEQVDRLGREGLVNPQESELPLASIDLYVRGIVRWMNELGIYTAYCCDGHGEKTPFVVLLHPPTEEQKNLLKICLPDGMNLCWQRRRVLLKTQGQGNPFELLLDFAERLHGLVQNPDLYIQYEANLFKERYVMDLLSVPGSSGREEQIRRVVRRKIRFLTDDICIDRCGNLLATRYCGDGPTILLSAHMDVCQELDPDREIVEDGPWLRSTSGILGADDRAGIAIALHLCERIQRTNFRGTLKLAFTVKEEIGLIGARNIDPWFMQDIDAAIVIDRRGKRDIVTSCRGVVPFCVPSYGRLFEIAGELAGMGDWKMAEGGSSDARIFAEQFRINTVNLSAGYLNEHTNEESLDYVAAYETTKLIETVLHHQLIEEWLTMRKT